MPIGWRVVPHHLGPITGPYVRRAALVVGSAASLAMGIVGCTSVTGGMATLDTAVAPAYRASVSASVSASSETSKIRESQRQQSLTAKAMRSACEALATTSKDAIDKVNDYVSAFNDGRSTGPTEDPAIAALNGSADAVAGSFSDALSPELHDTLNDWVEAAHAVANAIAIHASTSEFNNRVDRLNSTKTRALKLCLASF
ncbi:MAG: hypothetical protein K2Q25_04075 [Mycobacteriaceae bacterium]|nr:hypothetical protein [Mycobacteriaceae bacterium]